MATATQSPFQAIGHQLWQQGYSVIPIIPPTVVDDFLQAARGKAPGKHEFGRWGLMKEWNRYRERLPSDMEISFWNTFPDANIGVVLGEISGVIALDFDYDTDGLQQKIMDLIPDSPVKKIGAKGFTAFYQYNFEDTKQFSTRVGGRSEVILDVLSNGRQTVIPPSIHPNGAAYQWEDPLKTLVTIPKANLPRLPVDFLDQVAAIFEAREPKPVQSTMPSRLINDLKFKDATPEKIEEALKFIDPDQDYNTWIEVGMALKTHLGDSGYSVWDNWSASGSKYNDKGNKKSMEYKWSTFVKNEKTIASIFYWAQMGGYINTGELEDYVMKAEIGQGGNLEFLRNEGGLHQPPAPVAQLHSAKQDSSSIQPVPSSDIKENKVPTIDAPNLVGSICKYILETSIFPEPNLALACTLATLGVVKGHRITLDTGLRTNIYTLGIAKSGQGKNHAPIAARQILARTDQDKLLGGNPASSSGLFKLIADNNGRRLMMMDEFGKLLKSMVGRQASPHLMQVPTMMMAMFSAASTVYLGTEYANHDGKRDRQDIEQPCLCVYGTSTPDHFFQSLTSTDTVDGFLSRFLIFDTGDIQIYPQKNRKPLSDIPDDIVERMIYWNDHPTNNYVEGDIDAATNIKPRIVKFTGSAEKLRDQFVIDMRRKMKDHSDRGTGFDAVYSRVAEHAQKMAMIALEEEFIDSKVFTWACDLALDRAAYMCRAITEHVADNESEQEFKRVAQLVQKAGPNGINHSNLLRKTQFLKNRQRRGDILDTLVETNQIMVYTDTTGATKPTIYYKHSSFVKDDSSNNE